MSNSLFYTGISGLNSASSALATTGHNVANVATVGYTKQNVDITSAGGTYIAGTGFIGDGSNATGVTRSYNAYLTSQLNVAQSTNASLSTQSTQISQIDTLLASSTSDLSTQIQSFFGAIASVANSPSDTSARQSMVSGASSLATQFRSMSDYLTNINSNVNGEISGDVDQVNMYATQIASLNKQISQVQSANPTQQPNDLLDERDLLVNQLSQLVGTKVVVQGSQYNVFMGTGQTLVLGDKASTLKAVTSPSDPTQTSVAVVNAAGVAVPLQDGLITGGSLGGLLAFRNTTLESAQNAVGRLAISLSDTVNKQQDLGIDLNGNLGTNIFTQSSPAAIASSQNKGDLAVSAAFSDIGALTTSDYSLTTSTSGGGALQYTVTRLSDNTAVVSNATTFPITFDGVTLSAGTGTAQTGDSYLIQPTRSGATDITTTISDPSKIAAASPIVTGKTVGNTGTGTISAATVDSSYLATPLTGPVTLTYNSDGSISGFPAGADVTVTAGDGTTAVYTAGSTVPFAAGSSYSFNGIKVTLASTPAAGDTFTLSKNTSGVADGSNALLIGNLQTTKVIGGGTSTYSTAYGQLVSDIGTKASQLNIASSSQTTLTNQIQAQQQSISGVNQDEETTNLLMYQQMYQANAKVIQTASTMFDSILNAVN